MKIIILSNAFRIIVIFFFIIYTSVYACDVTVVGCVDGALRVTEQTLRFVSCLYKNIALEFVKAGVNTSHGTPQYSASFVQCGIDLPMQTTLCGCCCERVTIFADGLWTSSFENFVANSHRGIRLVCMTTKRTKIQKVMITRLNNFFDAVIVPDELLIDEYKKLGVKLPVFFLPLQVDLKLVKQKCMNLVKPKKLLLDTKNIVADDGLTTDSKVLYDKYMKIIAS